MNKFTSSSTGDFTNSMRICPKTGYSCYCFGNCSYCYASFPYQILYQYIPYANELKKRIIEEFDKDGKIIKRITEDL